MAQSAGINNWKLGEVEDEAKKNMAPS